jgi:hypothetical protein
MPLTVSPLEDILQRELDQSRIDRRAGDLSRVRGVEIKAPGICELGMIEEVEELRSELQRSVFTNPSNSSGLDQGSIEVELAGPVENSEPGVAIPPVGTDPNAWTLT